MSPNELEAGVIAAFRESRSARKARKGTLDAWIEFALTTVLSAGQQVRQARLDFLGVDYKGDGSPVTNIEDALESHVIESLHDFAPDAVIVGEETGGSLPDSGLAVAVDPIDGTWAFLSRIETIATTLAAFRDGEPFLGMVSNPVTGEIAYATHDGPTRILQLSIFGDEDQALTLPLTRADRGPILVNVHPGRSAGPTVGKLYDAWADSEVRMVRSSGGSPAWALLEAAKGSFVYANLWLKRPAEAYDLAAGCMLVRGAGGEVAHLDGTPIDAVSHVGPFVAAVDPEHRRIVAECIQSVTR